MIFNRMIPAVALFALAACTTARDTQPARTATEELLISMAADRVVEQLHLAVPDNPKLFVDAQYFDPLDGKYTISAIRDRLAQDGARLVSDRGSADFVVEIRSGGQSIDTSSTLIGIPSFPVPIPLSGSIDFPEIPIYKRSTETGVSKLAMTVYRQKDGSYAQSLGPDYGTASKKQWSVLFINWGEDDLKPPPEPAH